MRALMVGAGAVGQVYGWHLQRGGAEVHVFVRERHRAEAEAGYVLLPPKSKTAVRFRPDGICTDLEAVRAAGFDQVWLCVSSPGLRGPWLPELAAAWGAPLLVSLQPGLHDRDLLAPLAREQVVGLITFSAWHAPLGAEAVPEPGTSWWNPPFTPSLFQGARAAEVVVPLRAGGLPAAVGDAVGQMVRGAALLNPVVATLECADWRLDGLREEPWRSLAAQAAAEALGVATAHAGLSRGPLALAANPLGVSIFSRFAPWLATMDFEAFLRAHFTKVGDQTAQSLAEWIQEGEARALPVEGLKRLRAELARARGQA